MAKLSRVAGTTSQTLYVFLQDSASTAGAGKTGLAFNTASLTCYYTRPQAAAVAVSLATQTVTGAWATGGFVEVDATNCPGLYRFDPPNLALAAGVDQVNFFFKGTGVAPRPLELELTATNNQSTGGGLTNVSANVVQWNGSAVAAPNVAGVPKVDVVDWLGTAVTAATAGVPDVNAKNHANQAVVLDANNLLKVDVEDWKGGVVPAPNVTGVPKADVVDWLGTAPNALAQGKVDAALNLQNGTAQAGGASTITLAAGASATTDFYKGEKVTVVGNTGAGQCRLITGYNGGTKVATVAPAWATAPDATSTYIIGAWAGVDVELWGNAAPNALVSGRVDASAGALAANVVTAASINAAALNGKGDWLLASSAPSNFGALLISVGGHISNVDTLTTYTGNTVQTGDGFARLGAPAGASIAADLAEIEGETDALLAGVTVSAFAAGSITDAAFTVPAEAAGPPAGVLSRLMWAVARLGLRRVKKTAGVGGGTVATYLANGTSVWTTETYTTTAATDTTDDIGAGV